MRGEKYSSDRADEQLPVSDARIIGRMTSASATVASAGQERYNKVSLYEQKGTSISRALASKTKTKKRNHDQWPESISRPNRAANHHEQKHRISVFIMSIKSSTRATLLIMMACVVCLKSVSAQYGGGAMQQGKSHHYHSTMQQGYGGGGEMEEEEQEEEERPRINFGIRLRVPAMKLELPRFNLPKITVTAKIRQPDGPRVIQLPAINLDTSSRVEPPGARKQIMTQQPDDHTTGFDDDNTAPLPLQQHYRHPNSPANRVRQQQHSGYHHRAAAANYATPATSSYYRAGSAYRAPPVYHLNQHRSNGHRFY